MNADTVRIAGYNEIIAGDNIRKWADMKRMAIDGRTIGAGSEVMAGYTESIASDNKPISVDRRTMEAYPVSIIVYIEAIKVN